MAELKVSLVAADREVWEGTAKMVVARTVDGDVGVLPGHQPILSVLDAGPVTIKLPDDTNVIAAVYGGFISVDHDKVSLLAEAAELADEIDVVRAEMAEARAREAASGGPMAPDGLGGDPAPAADSPAAAARQRATGRE